MIPPRAVFKVLCVAFCILAPLSCGKDVATPIDCGNAATISAPPEVPNLGEFPTQTNKIKVTLFGTKSQNTDIGIDVNNTGTIVEAVTFDCLTTWAADVDLTIDNAPNSIAIFSANRPGTSTSSTLISITLDTTPPSAPTGITTCSPVVSPCTLSGSKLPGEAVFIDNRLVVEASAATTWSYDVTLTTAGDNPFSVQLQDAAGNKSTATPVTVNFTGTPLAAPNLIFPLGNTGVVSQTPQFRWSGNILLAYKIQVSTSVDFNTTILDATITGLSYTPSPIPPGRYYWRVGRIDTSTNNIFYSPPRKVIVGQSLCDFNDDGYDDVVVGGAYVNDSTGANAGKVYIYYGTSSFNLNTPDVSLTAEATGDLFGISVACAGDVNGDGVSDLIVGAYLNGAGGENAGRAYIFFGGSTFITKNAKDADIKLTGQAAGDQFGLSVSTAGDVNGDGIDDVIVGAYQNDGGGLNAGRAYIYFGGNNADSNPNNDMDDLPDVVLTGQAIGDQLGIRVAWAGDVNGDGFDDVIVGADRADVGTLIDAGKAYIFFGGPYMAGRNAGQADVILEGDTQDEAFASVARAGDLDNDGYDDIVVGASAYTAGSGSENCRNFLDDDGDLRIDRKDPDCYLGQAYVFMGGASLSQSISANNANFRLERPPEADGFGFSVASAGDVNGDGFSDLLVGAFLSDKVSSSEGNGTCTDRIDNDGDGLVDFDDPDCLVEDQGRAYLYLGNSPFRPPNNPPSPSPVVTFPDVTFIGETSPPGVSSSFIPMSGQFGFALSGGGDLNNDSFSDIIIGAYLYDAGITELETDVGKVYIFFGRASFSSPIQVLEACQTASTGHCFTGQAARDGFGVSVQ